VKRFLLGTAWFVIFYFGFCVLVGGLAGSGAGADDPTHAYEAGRMAGEKAVAAAIPYILGGSLLVAVLGSVTGFLPGTKRKPEDVK